MIAYIIKSSLSLILLFVLYWLLLRKEKLFFFNRFFLLFSIIFSLIIPFIVIPVNIQNKQLNNNLFTVLNNNIPSINQFQNSVAVNSNQQYNDPEERTTTLASTTDSTLVSHSGEKFISRISSLDILLILYILVVILLLFRFFKNILIIRQKLLLSEKVSYSGYRIALLDYQINPFCFLNTIFVNKQDYLDKNLTKELLAHEFEHIKQAHSIDVIFVELVQIFLWFNPILVLYNRAVRENHEYLADNGVVLISSDIKSYAENLLNFISYSRNIPLTTGFNQSLIRKRLLMLTKVKTNILFDRLRIFLTMILVVFSFLFLSCKLSNSKNLKIDLESNISNFKELYISQINAEISYLPLSSIKLRGISIIKSIDISPDYILVNDNKQCILYDKGGKQIAIIYEKGRSENEKYILLSSRFGPKNIIYIKTLDAIKEFDLSGNYLKTIDFNKAKDPYFYFRSWTTVNDTLIFAQIPNSSGNKVNKASIFNLYGDPVYEYKNHITLNRDRPWVSSMEAFADFNFYNNHIYFKERYNDTLFYLNSDFYLVPEFVFKLGKYSEPDSLREKIPPMNGSKDGYVYVNNTFQSKDYLFLDCNFSYNIPAPEKMQGIKQWWESGKPWYITTTVLGLYKRSDKTLAFSKLSSTANPLFTTGLYNDIDAGPRFYPFKQVNDSTYIMWMTASSFKDHIKSDDFIKNNTKFPEKKKSLEELASNLTDLDEIILMYLTIR